MAAREQLFADIDSMEPERFAAHLAEDVTMRFGNAEPIRGRDAVRDAWAAFCKELRGVRHELVGWWKVEEATIVEATVTYTRRDDSKVTVPVVGDRGVRGGPRYRASGRYRCRPHRGRGVHPGGCVIAELLARRPRRFAGAAVLTGSLLGPPDERIAPARADGLRMFFAVSRHDTWVALGDAQATAQAFERSGAVVAFEVDEDRVHHINDRAVAGLRALLTAG